MGSSSSAPTRIILPDNEAKGRTYSEKHPAEDTLNVPVTEQNYPEIKPPPNTRARSLSCHTSSDKSGRLSERLGVLPDIIESTERDQRTELKDIDNTTPKPKDKDNSLTAPNSGNSVLVVPNHVPQSTAVTPQSVSYEGHATPSTIPIYQAGRGLQVSTLSQQNLLNKGHSNVSILYRSKDSIPGSLMSSNIFNDAYFRLDSESRMQMKKREIMLLEREKYEYKQLLDQEEFNSLPERSPRVQAPTKLAKALAALKNPEQLTNDSLRDLDYSMADLKATELKDHKATTYTSLVQDLTSDLQNDALKVWAVLSWISKQAIGRISFRNKVHEPHTPNGYMQLIQENKGTYPVFFALLCRTAGIPCAVVHGVSKSSNYELGSQNIDDLRSSWNAVFIDDGWRLVHPLWVCRSIRGQRQGGWLTIEKDGQASKKLQVEDKGTEVSTYNSYYIFIDPKEFIYRNFPDESQWQLLKEPWSKEKFINSAYLRPEFFKRKLKLLSENKCVLVSEDGDPCNVILSLDHDSATDMVFRYDLSLKVENPDLLKSIKREQEGDIVQAINKTITTENDNDTGNQAFLTENKSFSESDDKREATAVNDNTEVAGPDNVNGHMNNTVEEVLSVVKERHANLHNFVAIFREQDTVRFEIRFLKKNTYRLRVFGGLISLYGSDPPCIMEVKLECLAHITEPKPLPFDPGIVGWGPGPVAESLGLFVPSHDTGVIDVSEEEETMIQFFLKKLLKVEVVLFHTQAKDTPLNQFVHYKILELKDTFELRIVILYPGKGEHALKIDVLTSQTELMENACNYLVHTEKKRPHEDFYARKARRMLLEAMLDVDTGALEVAVEACKQFSLPDDDPEYRGGKNRLAFLQSRRALKECLLVNRIDVTEEAIFRAKTARFRSLLAREIKKAERHLKDICQLNEGGWNKQVPDIDRQSLFEMCRLRKPKEEICQTMKAVYMLLGVDSSCVKTWSQIQLLMRKGEATIVEMARLEKYLELEEKLIIKPDEEALDEVNDILNTYTEEEVRKIDNTAAAFYQWVVASSSKLKQHHQKMRDAHSTPGKLESHGESRRASAISKITGQLASLANGVTEQFNSDTENSTKTRSILDSKHVKTH